MMVRVVAVIVGVLMGGCAADEPCPGVCSSSTTDDDTTADTHSHETHAHTHTDTEVTAGSDSHTETGHHTTDTSDTSESESTTEAAAPTPMDYCDCMLVACHDYYHDHWGDDHDASLTACLAEAEGVPVAGMPVTEGNFFECRYHYCGEAFSEPARCTEAAGMGLCQ